MRRTTTVKLIKISDEKVEYRTDKGDLVATATWDERDRLWLMLDQNEISSRHRSIRSMDRAIHLIPSVASTRIRRHRSY